MGPVTTCRQGCLRAVERRARGQADVGTQDEEGEEGRWAGSQGTRAVLPALVATESRQAGVRGGPLESG